MKNSSAEPGALVLSRSNRRAGAKFGFPSIVEGRQRCDRGCFDTEIARSVVDFAAVAKDVCHWFELKVTINDTSGTVELRRNGAVLLTLSGNKKAPASSSAQ